MTKFFATRKPRNERSLPMTPEELQKWMNQLFCQPLRHTIGKADLEELGRKIAAQQKRLRVAPTIKRDL